jgi:antirestriction protein ArdC
VIHNQARYVAGWLKKLRDDRKLLIHAAAQAQHAADYILGRPVDASHFSEARQRIPLTVATKCFLNCLCEIL